MRISELRDRLTEKEFQQMIVEYARFRGWRVHHDRGDYRQTIAGDPGFPDLVLARGGIVIFAELKTAGGKLRESQRAWLEDLGAAEYAFVWRPADWPQIQELLR
jgi:hypothetical protein